MHPRYTRFLCLLLSGGLFAPAALWPLEEMITTAELVEQAPYVALVQVETVQNVPGPVKLQNYRVILLENFKGRLPASFDVRIMIDGRIVPSGPQRPVAPGTRWILILGERNDEGVYPLRSLHWGKIEVIEDPRTGTYFLGRPVTGFGKGPANVLKGVTMSLDEFRARVTGKSPRE